MPVIVSPLAVAKPAPGEEARRIVRHRFARTKLAGMESDVLTWLGEDPGPEPDEPVPAAFLMDAHQMLVHPRVMSQLRAAAWNDAVLFTLMNR